MMRLMLLISTCWILPQAAQACSYSSPLVAIFEAFDFNQRVMSNADCSVTNVGEDDQLAGEAVVDLGGGFVSQKFYGRDNGVCSLGGQETISFTDCSINKSVTVFGVGSAHTSANDEVILIGPAEVRSVENALAALGQVQLARGENFQRLKRQGQASRISVRDGIVAYDADAPEWDRINPNCGCQLYYPDSIGASQ